MTSKPHVDKALLRQAAERVRDAALGTPTLQALRHLQACFGWETVLTLLAELDEADRWRLCGECGGERKIGPCLCCFDASVESAEAFAQRQAERIRAAFDFEMRVSSLAGDVKERDAAIFQEAELRGYRRALSELESLTTTKKWVAAGEISKEAAWGRAYQEAIRELREKAGVK